MGMIFRQNSNCCEVREMATPFPAVILENLENFKKRLSSFLSLDQMNRVRLEINRSNPHIKEGCSSHLKQGEGKEANRRLHNTLTSSSLCGTNTVGPNKG